MESNISDENFLEASQSNVSCPDGFLSEALERFIEYGKLGKSKNGRDNIETLMASVSEGRGLLTDDIKPLSYFRII